MALPLTNGKTIVSKHTLEQRLTQLDHDQMSIITGLQSAVQMEYC